MSSSTVATGSACLGGGRCESAADRDGECRFAVARWTEDFFAEAVLIARKTKAAVNIKSVRTSALGVGRHSSHALYAEEPMAHPEMPGQQETHS